MYVDLIQTRLSPKLSEANNLKNLLRFFIDTYDNNTIYIDMIRDLKNIYTDYNYSLDGVGHLIGVNRPIVPVSSDGYFKLDLSPMDNNDYPLFDFNASIGVNTIPATNEQYRRVLKASLLIANFNSTVEEYDLFFMSILGNNFDFEIINGAGEITINFNDTVSDDDKILVEESLRNLNLLTTSYSINYL